MPNSIDYWKDIDGKYLINYRVAALATPLAVLAPAIQETTKQHSALSYFDWVVASSTGWAIAAALYALSDITLFRERKNRKYPLSTLIFFGAFIGLVKGFFTSFTAIIMMKNNWNFLPDLYFRSLNGMLIGMIAVPISAFLLSSINEYKSERNRLINDYLFLEQSVNNDESVYEEMQSSLSEKVDRNLTEILLEAQTKIIDGASVEVQWQKIASILRDTAQNAIRPLSHEIWKIRRKEMNLSVLEFIRFAFQNLKLRPVLVIPLYTVTTMASLQLDQHIWHPTYTLILKDTLVWVLLEVMQILLEILRRKTSYALEIVLVLIAAIHYPVVELIYKATNYNDSAFDTVDTFWLIILVVITGIADSAMRTQIFQIKTLKELIDNKRFELIAKGRNVDRLSREMAKYLHGTIQSKLMAAAMAVELAGRKNDQRLLNLEIDRALQTLKMPSKEYLANAGIYKLSDLEDIIAKWEGIVKVEISGFEKIEPSETEIQQLIDVINECILNSYRHGQATSVQISLDRTNARLISIVARDNGKGLTAMKPGLGSSLFSTISKNWEISNNKNGSGAVLTIEF